MNLITRIRAALAQRLQPIQNRSYIIFNASGERVDHDTAMTIVAVWAAVRYISEAIGMLPHNVFQTLPNGGRQKRSNLYLDYLLRCRPNPDMNAQAFHELLTAHCATWGNGYAEIEWDGSDRPKYLWPLSPDRVKPKRDETGTLYYEYSTNTGPPVRLPQEDVLHLKGLGFDGTQGYDVITYMSAALGAGKAAQTHAASFFRNGAQLSIGLFHPKRLGKEGRANVRDAFAEQFTGDASKAYQFGIFEEGMTAKEFSVSPEAAQLIETRKFSVTEIARMFKLPPHKLADLERATFANIEHLAIEVVTDAILPYCIRWEQECDYKLLGRRLGIDHYTKLNLNALLRGDMKSRYDAYAVGRQWGWMSANDVRELEDMNPIEGEAGTRYLHPTNMADANNIPNPNAKQPALEAPPSGEPEEEPSKKQVAVADIDTARLIRRNWRKS